MASRQQHATNWEGLLGDLMVPVAEGDGPAPLSAASRKLHCISRKLHTAARTTIRHASLSRYQQGRQAAQRLVAEAGEPVTPAMAAAAAAPPIPWDLLAATPSLTSLDVRADQLEQLVQGGAAAAAAASSSAPAAPPAAAAGLNVLAATLGRLRCLRVVTGIDSEQQLAHLGQLLAGTTQLTRLVVKGSKEPVWGRRWYEPSCVSCRPLLAALKAASRITPAAAAAGGSGGSADGNAASGMLPPLRHLEVEGPLEGLLPAWLRKPQAAARLTTLRLTHGAALHLRLLSLASGLRELTLEQSYLGAGMVHPGIMPLPLGLTTLTRLVVWDCYMAAVPPGVCHFTTLRHLSLGTEYGKLRGGLPSSMSSLQQLQRLDLRGRHLIELPADLGTWLPQLEELDVCGTSVSDLPRSLTRLTRLAASGTRVTQVSAVAHLVTLKELCMESSVLRPPLQPLAQLSALERLQLGWSKRLPEEMAAQLHLPTPLPALCSLAVRGPLLVDQVQEVVVGAQQLTRLALTINLGPEEVAALGQLGVLPRLKRLELSRVAGATQWAAAAPWLQQQPCLTSLKLSKGEAEGSLLPQLPAQLEELHIHPYVCVEGSVQGVEQPTALTQLSRLRKLSITCHDNQVVPSWLSSLRSLEVLEVTGWKVYHGWEVLAQLPLLRQVRVEEQSLVHALRHAPHLCWALPVVDN